MLDRQNDKVKKFNSFAKKYAQELLQLVAMGLLFLFVLNKELIVFVKEFIGALPVGGSLIESIALRGYVIFNLLSNSPSIVIFTLLFLQVVLFVYTINLLAIIFCKPFMLKEDVVVVQKKILDTYTRNNKTTYLENLRLLC